MRQQRRVAGRAGRRAQGRHRRRRRAAARPRVRGARAPSDGHGARSSSRPSGPASRARTRSCRSGRTRARCGMQLDPLGDAAVDQLVETALGGPVEQAALRWMPGEQPGQRAVRPRARAGGAGLGRLVFGPDLWRLSSPPPVSRSLMELVSERMADLDAGGAGAAGGARARRAAARRRDRRAQLDGLARRRGGAGDGRGRAAGGGGRGAPHASALRRGRPPGAARAARPRRCAFGLAEQVARADPLPVDDAVRVARWLLDAGARDPGRAARRRRPRRHPRRRSRPRRAARRAGRRGGHRPRRRPAAGQGPHRAQALRGCRGRARRRRGRRRRPRWRDRIPGAARPGPLLGARSPGGGARPPGRAQAGRAIRAGSVGSTRCAWRSSRSSTATRRRSTPSPASSPNPTSTR